MIRENLIRSQNLFTLFRFSNHSYVHELNYGAINHPTDVVKSIIRFKGPTKVLLDPEA